MACLPFRKPVTSTISLEIFREHSLYLAVVVDEHGGTAGIITVEDVLEEMSARSTTSTKIPWREPRTWEKGRPRRFPGVPVLTKSETLSAYPFPTARTRRWPGSYSTA
ncbi:MAG: hypothetical protein Ct9H300mP31_17960 [Acidimicrobiaceae bacterium]|nr:MAG: hypothetical protein Ct9H300mP31_17960 [Acidimicrobiaceae bacterium]